jgi:predicted DNA-binding protein YlxM (UPF0122 family)
MNFDDLVKKINLLLKRKEELESENEVDPVLNEQVEKYYEFKELLNEEEKKIVELYYEKNFTNMRVAVDLDFSQRTLYRKIDKIKDKFYTVLGNDLRFVFFDDQEKEYIAAGLSKLAKSSGIDNNTINDMLSELKS